jgi:hypothetical protein
MLNTFWSSVAELWCRLMHAEPMWPVHGHYRCRLCWREYPARWEASLFVTAANPGDRLEQPAAGRTSGGAMARPVPTW